jgi:hypothetical protein
MIISGIMVAMAAVFNAVMDRTEEPVNFNESVFRGKNQRFWLKSVSWQYARKIFGWKADMWHISKSAMIILLCGAMVFYKPWIPYYLDILPLGFIWNMVFNIFYNHLFVAK